MDWYEACDDIALNFHKSEKELGSFLSRHGAILSEQLKDLISYSEGIASENKLEITGPEVPASANEAADEMFKKINEAEKCLLSQILSQSST